LLTLRGSRALDDPVDLDPGETFGVPGSPLRCVPAEQECATRLSILPFGVDVFEGPEGLILAEIEFETRSDADAFMPGIDVVGEVTYDVRFTGGRLVATTAAVVADLLREFGLA
jgi:hypothetical protein